MDIKILDSWLREHLVTSAKPADIARAMSLSGPTFDRTHKIKINGKTDWLYEVEITTNRVDLMSVRGLAKEASVILPEHGYKAKLIKNKAHKPSIVEKSVPLTIKSNSKLTYRVMGVVLEVDKLNKSPKWMKERLEATGIRSLNTAVDITNYIMTEIGHPTHVFDYDLIAPRITLRESKKGEKITSLDGKKYTLSGGDIVIENSEGEIVDLPGIIGTKNSVVRDTTRRILFFLETNDPVRIRKTSMTLGIRTVAATLNEKGVSSELAEHALYRGIDLFESLMNAKQVSKIHDIYTKKQTSKIIHLNHEFIEKLLGITIKQKRVVKILQNLGFVVQLKNKSYSVTPPPSRAKDVQIPEDIVEEVARMYGYHNLPSEIMTGVIPEPLSNAPFEFEWKLKQTLKELGSNEVYTYSLVSESMTDHPSLKIKNPLGREHSYLRTTLMPSLAKAAKSNARETSGFSLFEISNIYIPRKGKLPEERMILAGIMMNKTYRDAKGVLEKLLASRGIDPAFSTQIHNNYRPGTHLVIKSGKIKIGEFGILHDGEFYYEFDVDLLRSQSNKNKTYVPISQFPPQIEDTTLVLPQQTKVGEIISHVLASDSLIVKTKLLDIYEDSYTFRIWYQDKKKTLTDSDVSTIRERLLKSLQKKFGTRTKD